MGWKIAFDFEKRNLNSIFKVVCPDVESQYVYLEESVTASHDAESTGLDLLDRVDRRQKRQPKRIKR